MATTWKAPTWRMPNDKNQSKFESYSLDFDGNTEYINCGTDSTIQFQSTFSISCWVKTSNTSQNKFIIHRGVTYSETFQDYRLLITSAGNAQLKVNNNSYSVTSTETNLDDGNWHHIVAICDLENTDGYIYVDNGTPATNPSFPSSLNLNTGYSTYISSPGGTFDMIGEMSQICIFDYALSSTQVSSLYNSGSPINPMTLKPAPIANYLLGGDASTGGNATLSVPNVAVPDASVFDFDGSSFINFGTGLGNLLGDSYAGDLTFSTWIKLPPSSNNQKGIFCVDNTNQPEFALVNFTNQIWLYVSGDGTNPARFSTSIEDNNWHHLVFVYDSDNESNTKLYIDNSPATKTKETAQPTSLNFNGDNTVLGTYFNTAGTFDLTGQLSNSQIWNTALSSSEVSTLYNSGVPLLTGTQPQESNLKAWYKLDQSANWEADTTGNWQIPDAVSSYPQSFDLDATSQEINFSTIDLGTEHTISMWVHTTDTIPLSNFMQENNGRSRIMLYIPNRIYYRTNDLAQISPQFGGLSKNKWINIVILRNGETLNFYVDKILKSTNSFGGTNFVFDKILGLNANFQASNIQLWTTALTDGSPSLNNPATGQIAELYNNGVPLTTAIATDNLKAWYKLNDNEIFNGTNWEVENQKYSAGFDSALNFNSSYIQVPDSDSLSFGNGTDDSPFSISAWIKTTNGSSRGIMSKWGNGPNGYEWIFWAFSNKISLVLYNSGTSSNYRRRTGNTSINNGKWTHVLATYDGRGGNTANQGIKIYINGVEESSYTDFSSGSYTAMTNTMRPVQIGAYNSGLTLNGEISNVAIFNTDLGSPAITALYNNGTPETSISSSPISWWKLDNTTTGIQDSVGNNNGTNNGTTKVNTFVSTQAGTSSGMTEQNLVNNNVSALNGESSGMDTSNLVTSTLTRQVPYNSYSLNFDGTDNVDCGDIGLYTPEISFSCWIYPTNNGRFIKYGNSSSSPLLWCYVHNSTDLRIYVRNVYRVFSSCINLNQWHHIAITRTNYNDGKVYVNGVSQGDLIGTAADLTQTGNLTIGDSHNGLINNFSVFNEALTSTEVLKLYNSGVPGNLSNFTPSPISWWSLGSDSYFNGTSYICPDLISTNNGTSSGMDANALIGDAPNSSANGTSTNMTIDANLTGNAPNSSNNSFSVNMDYRDRVSGSGDVPG